MVEISRKHKLREFSLTHQEADPALLKVAVKTFLIKKNSIVKIHTIIQLSKILMTLSIFLSLLRKPRMPLPSLSSVWRQLLTQDQRIS